MCIAVSDINVYHNILTKELCNATSIITKVCFYDSQGSVVVDMEIYTREETPASEVESSIQSSLEGGCQATSASGSTFQLLENCDGK